MKELLKEIVNLLVDELNPERIILFGSRSKNRAHKYSDFDIAIEGVDLDLRKERKIKEILDEISGVFTVDLTNLDKADKKFREIVYHTGEILYERGSDLRSRKSSERL